jgi:4-hydroxybutyrate dehydrogenase
MALINYLTRIHFADRVIDDALAEQLQRLGIRRPLVVTDTCGLGDEPLGRVTDAMPRGHEATILIVHQVMPHEKAAADIQSEFVARQFALSLARHAAHDASGAYTKRAAPGSAAVAARPGMIAVPTSTACVGLQPVMARMGRGARRGRAADSAMLPDVVLCDPTLTLGQSESATAAAGMDALAHCIEAYLSMTWNPPADGIALDGVRRASANLDRAVHHGGDLDARREMMAAALDAGLAAQKGLGSVEALSHALEAETGLPVPHGHLHAALLPVVLAFNAPAINSRMAALRDALRVSRDDEVGPALSTLGARIHLPQDLRWLQLDGAGRTSIARRAAEHPSTRTNPRHATCDDYVRMLEHAN